MADLRLPELFNLLPDLQLASQIQSISYSRGQTISLQKANGHGRAISAACACAGEEASS